METEKLSFSSKTTIPRPIWNDEMFKELCVYVGTIVNKWCNNETPLEECIESAKRAVFGNACEDGYTLAKEFENEGFNSDSHLVDELDFVWNERQNILNKHIKQWVFVNDVLLTIPIGTLVEYTINGKEVAGEVVEHKQDTAMYGIWSIGLGYEKGKGYRLIPCESVKRI